MTAIHHFVPVVHRGDAVGRHTLRLRDATRQRGFESRIYVDVVDPDTAGETTSVLKYPHQARKGDVLVYQFATASYMAPWLTSRRETLVINYHNITPPELIAPWDNYLALGQLRAQSELGVMASRTSLAVADSAYNERHLRQAGYVATAVVPPSAALEGGLIDSTPPATAHVGGERGGARWLSVGRLAPNKAVEDTIAALAIARAHYDAQATLLVIGRPVTPSYEMALHRYVTELGLNAAVTFAGHASDTAVAAAYAAADVLVVTSEHEGFCVPVVEAMTVGLPVVAYGRGALPEVVGHAGVIVDSKDPYALASAIGSLTGNRERRAAMVEAGRARVRQLGLDSAADRFADLLCGVAEGRGARA